MISAKYAISSISRICTCVMIVGNIFADEGGIPRKTWPESWFHAPKTASECSIERFVSSPYLSGLEKSGALPPVADRLPDDPVVIEPLEEIGVHGGTARIFRNDVSGLVGLECPLIMDPDVRNVLPSMAKGWKYSDGGKTFHLYLRPGLKWSDGVPLTADDFLFWFEKIQMNEELNPVPHPQWRGSTIEKVDSYTVKYAFTQPYPFFINELAHHGNNYFAPKHFLKSYHPDFTEKEKLEASATEQGYLGWMAFFNAVRGERSADVFGTPTTLAYVIKKKSPTLWTYERNPYYYKVDPAGNQLPYIDRVMAQVVGNEEVMTAKASTGQVDFAGNTLKTQDIPLFKLGEKTNNFRTLIWNRLHGVDVVIQPNLTNEDPGLRKIFQDFRFRRAMSIAIHREEINTIVYFRHGTPRQTCVIPSSRFYEKEFAEAYTKYQPDAARQLLDDMGIIDRNGDGLRERPNGSALDITLEWVSMETPKGLTMELVVEYWREVGLDVRLKQINGNLQATRARANMMQMTLWHADRTTDILFPPEPFWFVPMHSNWEECHWMLWSQWYLTEGEKGEEPIPEVKKLIVWWDEMRTTMDEQRRIVLGKNILRSQAENLWTIGTIGLAPHPLVVSNKLRNVATRGYWGWDNRWTYPYHPETWYLRPSK